MTIDEESRVLRTTELASKLISVLPPAFIMLCLINVAFLGFTAWLMSTQMEQRIALFNRVVDACQLIDRGK